MKQQINVVMAQLNFLVGDIDFNASLIIEKAEEAIQVNSADIIVYPELALTGYPPRGSSFSPESICAYRKSPTTNSR